MKTSVRWLNRYLTPGDITPPQAERILTQAGFPIETTELLPSGDTMIDVEITSNRGDCISHLGLAREIAAATGRTLTYPAIPATVASGSDVPPAGAKGVIGDVAILENRVPDVCSLFTARVIRGVKVGPSPAWLVDALAAVGQRSINNIVDITNFVLFEFGQPSHVFDLKKLRPAPGAGQALVLVRYATKGEKLTLLDGKTVDLRDNELVVADGVGAVSLAGIMGGHGSEVTESTTDVLFEAATWDPVTVRRAARRLAIRTDASYRFERTVDPRTIDRAARRAAALILELGGPDARLLPGVLQAGAPAKPQTKVSVRVQRCRDVLGVEVGAPEMVKAFRGHEIDVAHQHNTSSSDLGVLECVIPSHRPDLDREIDLIEEVARTIGLERIPIHDKIGVRIAEPQVSERATRAMANVLTGLGFYETVTFSFVAPKQAEAFLPKGLSPLVLCDERRKADPMLRPSVIPGLLACRKANQDGNVVAAGGVRLFEIASIFAQDLAGAQGAGGSKGGPNVRGKEIETRVLALLADAAPIAPGASTKALDLKQDAVRLVRGAIESVVRALGGERASIELVKSALPVSGYDPAASAEVRLISNIAGVPKNERIGLLGLLHPDVLRQYDLQTPAVAAELNVGALLALFPPRTLVQALPEFPGIERDLSFVVSESTAWASIDQLVQGSKLELLVGHEFVTTFRGPQLGAGKKSVTVRLAFRDPVRTLRHEEVDPQVAALVKLAQDKLGATLRV